MLGLLAFIKAADTRKNASFVVRTPKHFSKREKRAFKQQDISDSVGWTSNMSSTTLILMMTLIKEDGEEEKR